jgi:hypothetical protein
MLEMEEAILKKDFEKFADLTMKVSVYLLLSCSNYLAKHSLRSTLLSFTNKPAM